MTLTEQEAELVIDLLTFLDEEDNGLKEMGLDPDECEVLRALMARYVQENTGAPPEAMSPPEPATFFDRVRDRNEPERRRSPRRASDK